MYAIVHVSCFVYIYKYITLAHLEGHITKTPFNCLTLYKLIVALLLIYSLRYIYYRFLVLQLLYIYIYTIYYIYIYIYIYIYTTIDLSDNYFENLEKKKNYISTLRRPHY